MHIGNKWIDFTMSSVTFHSALWHFTENQCASLQSPVIYYSGVAQEKGENPPEPGKLLYKMMLFPKALFLATAFPKNR